MSLERIRLQEARGGKSLWKKWGPYLSERQWGTVREHSELHGSLLMWGFLRQMSEAHVKRRFSHPSAHRPPKPASNAREELRPT